MGPSECHQSDTDLVGTVSHNRAVLVLRHAFVVSFLVRFWAFKGQGSSLAWLLSLV